MPRRPGPPRSPINMRIRTDLLDLFDELARSKGRTRTQAVERLMELALEGEARKAVTPRP